MPHIKMTLSGVDDTVSRPIIITVIKQLLKVTGLKTNSRLVWPREYGITPNQATAIGDTSKDATFSSETTTYLEIKEIPNQDCMGPGGVQGLDGGLIWKDGKLGVAFSPIYLPMNVEVEFRYETTNRGEARRWYQDMCMRLLDYRDVIPHAVDYSINLPGPIIDLLKEIHTRREQTAGYGQDLETYVSLHSAPGMTIKSDLVGKNTALTWVDRQERIHGYFDISVVPDEPEYDRDAGTYKVAFPYKFSYMKPIGIRGRYPISVHNRLLSKEWTSFVNTGFNPSSVPARQMAALRGIQHFETDVRQNHLRSEDYIHRYPSYDDFSHPKRIPGTGIVWSVLASVGDDKRTLVNLDTLPGYSYRDAVWAFMTQSERVYMTRLYTSVFQVVVYQDQDLMALDNFHINEQFDIVANFDLDPRKVYHVTLCMVTDLNRLPEEAFERIRKYPDALGDIVDSINVLVKDYVDLKALNQHGTVSKRDFDAIYRILVGAGPNRGMRPQTPVANQGKGYGGVLSDYIDSVVLQLRAKQKTMRTSMVTSIMVKQDT